MGILSLAQKLRQRLDKRAVLSACLTIFVVLWASPELRQALSPVITFFFHASCYFLLFSVVLWGLSFLIDLFRCR